MNRSVITRKVELLLHSIRSYEPERVYLFGSAAKAEADDLSDGRCDH